MSDEDNLAKTLFSKFAIHTPEFKKICLYYNLYRANYYNSDNSMRQSFLLSAKKFEEPGINVTELYNKTVIINDLINQINQKQSNISKFNDELNTIKNNIRNQEYIIKSKRGLIKNKNDDINKLNLLADSLSSKNKEINNEADKTINNEKNQVNEIKVNIDNNKDFMKQLKIFEDQKKEDINNMKNNNALLKQKNQELTLILNSLENKFC